jgi:hypothetical protein
MDTRASLFAKMADENLTPFDRVNAWFTAAGMEGYGVLVLSPTLKAPIHNHPGPRRAPSQDYEARVGDL